MLAGNEDKHKSLDEFKFRSDPTIEYIKNRCLHFFSVAIDHIVFRLASILDMYIILDEFKFSQIGPLTSEQDVLAC